MSTTLEQLQALLSSKEDEHLEFKEAKESYEFDKLVKYCVALANEMGGRIVFGVSDKLPRRVVGTRAFDNADKMNARLIEHLQQRTEVDAFNLPEGRVVVFSVPARPVGFPVQYKGAYWMRRGEDLVPMTPDMLRRIFAEAQPDHSATVCPSATLADLDERAIDRFRSKWFEKSKRSGIQEAPIDRLLEDAELTVDGEITYTALILLGTRKALGRHLGQAEVVFEYRSDEASIAHEQRVEYREGFLIFEDDLWRTINLRNDLFSLQDGFYRRDIATFNEMAVREAILNAVSHRDYRMGGSVFVRQYPKLIRIESPGGFPEGINAENILERQSPRNRRLAQALAHCGLVERSGQGIDRMFTAAVSEGKLPPDFGGSDQFLVSVVLNGQVQDERFLRFLERIASETQRTLRLDDLVVLDAIRRELPIPERVKSRIPALIELGALERTSPKRLTLSHRYYAFVGKRGEYTRRRGLDRETSKALLLQHIERNRHRGSPFSELHQVLPGMSGGEVQSLLRDLRLAGAVNAVGTTRAARWYPVNQLPEGDCREGNGCSGDDRERDKARLLQCIQHNAEIGSSFGDLRQVLPGMRANEVQSLLRELRNDGLVRVVGRTRAARWFQGHDQGMDMEY